MSKYLAVNRNSFSPEICFKLSRNNDLLHFFIVVVVNGRVKVYVDGAKEPCMDVEKLSTTKAGKVGLWFNGIAAFANLKITERR